MGLEDFDKVSNNIENVKNEEDTSKFVCDFDVNTISYFVFHMDELIVLLKDSYIDYVNANLKYDLKKSDLQVNTNWNEENALREMNGLPKVTAQGQRDSIINLKVKPLKINLENCQLKYKFYDKLFKFISKNYELILAYVEFDVDGKLDEIEENILENHQE